MHLEFIINKESNVIEFLKQQGVSRRLTRKMKTAGSLLLNKKPANFYTKVYPGDELFLEYNEQVNEEIPISTLPINVIYEDEYLLIVMKENNLSVQPSKKHFEDNLISRVKNYYLNQGIKTNIHIVNRLDYATSGLVLVAKEGFTQHLLSLEVIEKKYLAIVKGIPLKTQNIDIGIMRDPNHTIKRMVHPQGQRAITNYQLLEIRNGCGVLELKLITGRTHQLRLHMASINHPIIGDGLYGSSGDQLLLHSYYLAFKHPYLNKKMVFINYPFWWIKNVEI